MAFLLEKIANIRKTQNINVFLCGLRSSGKTTLLYKSLMNDWHNICTEIEPTTLYHYEELHFGGMKYGIWDFSGDVKVRYIPAYVARQVQATAVVYLVTGMEHSTTARNEMMDWIHSMERDDAFATSIFIVLFNKISPDEHSHSMEEYMKDNLLNKDRFLFLNVNVTLGLHDPNWVKALEIIRTHYKKHTTAS
ncbi:hypothetical protein X943_001211 [Babesia divergens]|uniref:ADP-ribosylation factor n=1 Tax=Babesia divergens TaxID=32595 RepID=A0AAD9LHF1_BABDI|nr:hypothetical protein X943_001211 [Babesia divergens]